MSQHYFHTDRGGEPITVLLGWDAQRRSFFMVVERQASQPDENDYLYIDAHEREAFELDLEDFRARLDELGIVVPRSMFEQARVDQLLHAGSRVVTHRVDGTFLSHPLPL